jgi:tetratricopeptide (TPR) repeat protein
MAAAAVCLVGLTEFLAWYFGTPLFPAFAQGWFEIGGWQQPIPPIIYRLAITLNGSTPLSAYLALLIPPAIGLIITLPPQNQQRQALFVWLVLAVLVQILTFSRAGVLALAVSLSLTAIGWYRISGGRSWVFYWQRLTPLYRLLLIIGGGMVVGAGLFWLQRSFASRVGSTQFRFVLWETALTIFQSHLLTGAGPGNFGRALLYLNDTNLPRLQIGSAHNVYLNTAAELGLVGLIAGGYLVFRVGQAWWRRWREISEPPERIGLLTCGAALVGLAAQTLVDTYSATPNILVMLALVAYFVADLKPTPLPARQRLAAYLAASLLVVYALAFAWIGWADLHFQNSFKAEQTGNLAEAIHQAKQAYALDPYLSLRLFRLALLEARLAHQTDDSQALQTAVEHYQLGLRQEPILGLNSANLAGLLWRQGQRTEAIALLEQTVMAAKDPLYLINLGHFYEQTGDWARASAAYGQALFLAPDLAESGFWQAAPERAEKWPTLVEKAVEQVPSADEAAQKLLRLQLTPAREEAEAVETLAELVSPVADPQLRAALAGAYLNRAQPEQAMALLDPGAMETSQDYLLWGRIKLEMGEQALAERLLKTAVFLGDSRAYTALGQLYEQRGDLPAAEKAYQSGFSPHYTSENIEVTIYGRLGANDLAPQLLRLGVSPNQAASWLILARMYEEQGRFAEAKYIYELLLAEDPFLNVAEERLALLQKNLLSPD